VATSGPWGQVRGANNRIEIVSRSAGRFTLDGAGAGGHATALALLSDLQSPVRDVPVHDAPVCDVPVRDAPVRDVPVHDAPVHDARRT